MTLDIILEEIKKAEKIVILTSAHVAFVFQKLK